MSSDSISSSKRLVGAALVWAVAWLLWLPSAHAQDNFFSTSPGKLTVSHQGLDTVSGCNDCHTGGKGLSNQKCLGCHDHKNLRRQINAGKGFHASAKVRGRKCESCHSEHRGRKYNLMGWSGHPGGERGFDHNLTGWRLNGKHRTTGCEDCHKTKNRQGLRTYLGLKQDCASCHVKESPHGFKRKSMNRCERCHGESVWDPPKRKLDFNHNKKSDSKFPLEGSHNDVACGKCHPRAKFNLGRKDPGNCSNCHQSPHDGHLFGKKRCDWCHSAKFRSNKKFKFNHDRTQFKLRGAHLSESKKKRGCYSCHTKKLATKSPSRACETCHANDNPHKDRFKAFGRPAPRCATCHKSGIEWKRGATTFSHNRYTKFRLTGKHASAKCRDCHRGSKPWKWEKFNAKTVGCQNCHQHENVHDNKYKDSECTKCHKAAGVKNINRKFALKEYHGPNSSFPLVKGHAGVDCVKCHENDEFAGTPAECGVRCHEDSLHKGSLGDACSNCHGAGTWKATEFDHVEDTEFPLLGLHQTVPACADCHPKRDYSNTPSTCASAGCHAKDDVHQGKLGNKCEDCHLETGDNIFDHNAQSAFKLDGSHVEAKCSGCHDDVRFKPQPTDCYGCHPEPDVHLGQFGTLCENCHKTTAWERIAPLHDVGDFALKGSHDNLSCRTCHKDSRPLQGTGNLCINCHRQDDIHANSLSPRCGTCHTQWAFAPARFDHTNVGCNLTSIHRVTPCYDCHQTGNFRGLSPNCASCHRDDSLRQAANEQAVNGAPPPHLTYFTCSGCHGPNTWVTAEGLSEVIPGRGYGRESICR